MRAKLKVPVLTAGDLRLRPFEEHDVALVRAASEDPHIPLITTVPHPFTEEGGRAFIERQWGRALSGAGYPFVIEETGSRRGIGFIGLWLGDLQQGRASIGYWVIPSERERGTARRALKIVVEWAFHDLSIPRLELYIEPGNKASVRTAEAVGFTREGLLRSWQEVGDERSDMYMYSRIRPSVTDSQSRSRQGVAITGTIGAGKTAVAEALSELLHSKAMCHAVLDVDWLGQVYPPPDPDNPHSFDLAFTNLATIAPNFIAAGADHFVIALTLTSHEELDELRRALPQVSVTVCRLEAPPRTIAERIQKRDLGSLRDDFLRKTDALAKEIRDSHIDDFVVSNDQRPIADAAQELLERLNWK